MEAVDVQEEDEEGNKNKKKKVVSGCISFLSNCIVYDSVTSSTRLSSCVASFDVSRFPCRMSLSFARMKMSNKKTVREIEWNGPGKRKSDSFVQ